MEAQPGPAYQPDDFTRGYSREQIVEHVAECLSIFGELDAEWNIADAIAPSVFAVVQTMVAAVEPTEDALKKALARQQIVGEANGKLGIVGRG